MAGQREPRRGSVRGTLRHVKPRRIAADSGGPNLTTAHAHAQVLHQHHGPSCKKQKRKRKKESEAAPWEHAALSLIARATDTLAGANSRFQGAADVAACTCSERLAACRTLGAVSPLLCKSTLSPS